MLLAGGGSISNERMEAATTTNDRRDTQPTTLAYIHSMQIMCVLPQTILHLHTDFGNVSFLRRFRRHMSFHYQPLYNNILLFCPSSNFNAVADDIDKCKSRIFNMHEIFCIPKQMGTQLICWLCIRLVRVSLVCSVLQRFRFQPVSGRDGRKSSCWTQTNSTHAALGRVKPLFLANDPFDCRCCMGLHIDGLLDE